MLICRYKYVYLHDMFAYENISVMMFKCILGHYDMCVSLDRCIILDRCVSLDRCVILDRCVRIGSTYN